MKISSFPSCPVAILDQFAGTAPIGYVFLHEVHKRERYVTSTYRLHELQICEQCWYVTTIYHLYTIDGK